MRDEPEVSVGQLLDQKLWNDFPGTIDLLVEKSAEASRILRLGIADVYTKSDIGIYWNPVIEKAALYIRPEFNADEFNWCLAAITEKVGADHVQDTPLTPEALHGWWVKVAYSPTLRRAGELLKFFPNSPDDQFGGRPIASTIASGLLGAGLGYGSGWLLDKATPKFLRDKHGRLKYWGAALGGLLGSSLGAVPGFVNWHDKRDFNDPTLWRGFPEDGFDAVLPTSRYQKAIANHLKKQDKLTRDVMQQEKEAFADAGFSSTFGGPSFEQAPLINTNELGQVLWGTNASPQTTAMTMGAMYGANQMPDPRSGPGVVTPHQTGLLGMAMGAAGGGIKGYVTGFVVGKGLGILTGMPQSTQNTLKQTGAALGVINSLVPRLFN